MDECLRKCVGLYAKHNEALKPFRKQRPDRIRYPIMSVCRRLLSSICSGDITTMVTRVIRTEMVVVVVKMLMAIIVLFISRVYLFAVVAVLCNVPEARYKAMSIR